MWLPRGWQCRLQPGGCWVCEQGRRWWETSLTLVDRSPQGWLDRGELGKANSDS